MKKNLKILFLMVILIAIVSLGVLALSERDYIAKKNLVEKDENEYGEIYEIFKSEVYKEEPERIIIKKENTKNEFYIFDKENKEYEHLLRVALDRMYYSSNQDFNFWSFTPYSIDDISNSNENFIIFDYNDDISQKSYFYDTDFNRTIFFRFSNQTRLYRLIDYLTYKETKYSIEELRERINKEEFIPEDQIISGYKYMHPSYNSD